MALQLRGGHQPHLCRRGVARLTHSAIRPTARLARLLGFDPPSKDQEGRFGEPFHSLEGAHPTSPSSCGTELKLPPQAGARPRRGVLGTPEEGP